MFDYSGWFCWFFPKISSKWISICKKPMLKQACQSPLTQMASAACVRKAKIVPIFNIPPSTEEFHLIANQKQFYKSALPLLLRRFGCLDESINFFYQDALQIKKITEASHWSSKKKNKGILWRTFFADFLGCKLQLFTQKRSCYRYYSWKSKQSV